MDNNLMAQQKTLPELKKQPTSYSLNIPKNVEEKIRYLIRKYPHTEWSGILFYKFSGSFENNNLLITCQDIYPMDVGTSGWTDFNITPDVAAYMADNMELFECETGLIHSHHTLGAFFSSQDISTLRSEGDDTNCFVSLIVDTKGTYQAAITRKIKKAVKYTVELKNKEYEFFGNGTINVLNTIDNQNLIQNKEVESEVIEYFMLNVTREVIDNPLDSLDLRMQDIENNKKRLQYKDTYSPYPLNNREVKSNLSILGLKNNSQGTEASFNTNITTKKQNKSTSYNYNYNNIDSIGTEIPNENIISSDAWEEKLNTYKSNNHLMIKEAAVRLVTCSLIMSAATIDLKQWITKYLDKVYTKLFAIKGSFDDWKDFVLPYIIDHYTEGYTDEDHNLFITAVTDFLLPYAQYQPIATYIDELAMFYIADSRIDDAEIDYYNNIDTTSNT